MEPTSRRLGLVWLLAWTHMGVLTAFLVIGRTGTAARLFSEQLAWAFGVILTGGRNADGFVLMAHLAAMATLALALWLWHRGDPKAPTMMRAAAIAQFAIAPIGVPIGAALWWTSRRPELQDVSKRLTVPSGSARFRLVLVWLAATTVTMITSVMAYFLFERSLILWLGAVLVAALPQAGILFWLLSASPQPRKELSPDPMPPLPEFDRQ